MAERVEHEQRTTPPRPPEPRPESDRYRHLPKRIAPEDLVATVDTEAPPDPTMGRDPERDFMLRNVGFY